MRAGSGQTPYAMKIRKTKTVRRSKTPRRSSTKKPRSARSIATQFKPGNPGKQKGTKDKVPGQRAFKASIVAIMQEVAEQEGKTIRSAFMSGIKGGPRHADRYLKLMAEYMDGKPQDTLSITRFDDDELSTAEQRTDAQIARLMKSILAKRQANDSK